MARRERVRITLVTGFLGSGKTTLIDRQLRRPDFPRASTALVINDAGPVNVDARVLRGRAARIEALTGGCACCVTPRQLVEALMRFASDEAIERIWIEASGVAEPEEMLERLTDSALVDSTMLGAVVHVIDGEQMEKAWMPGLRHREQVRHADVVVLTRADRLKAEVLEQLVGRVREWNDAAQVVAAWQGKVELPEVEAATALGAYFLPRFGDHVGARAVFVPMKKAVERVKLERALQALPEDVWRAKGFVRFEGEEGIYFVQYVAGTGRIEAWRFGAEDVPLGVVGIGRGLKEEWLRSWLVAG